LLRQRLLRLMLGLRRVGEAVSWPELLGQGRRWMLEALWLVLVVLPLQFLLLLLLRLLL